MDTCPLVAGDAVAAVIVVPEQDRMLPAGWRESNPPPGICSAGRSGAGKRARTGLLRTCFRCAINAIIARRIDVCNSSFAPLFQGVWSTSGW